MAETLEAASAAEQKEERREHPRYALSLAITMRGENNFYTGLSEDLSEGGIFIATHHELPIGTPVMLSFTLPTCEAPVTVRGVVQWVRSPYASAKPGDMFGGGRDAAGAPPGMGVQFSGIDLDAVHAIREFTSRRAPAFFDA